MSKRMRLFLRTSIYAGCHQEHRCWYMGASICVCRYVMCIHIRIYMRACVRACEHACMHTCMRAYTQTGIHAYRHTWMHACKHTGIHACEHTSFLHTYVHTYMHAACMHASIIRYDTPTMQHMSLSAGWYGLRPLL